MLDAIAADPELAVETVRAKKRSRARDADSDTREDETGTSYRDPGYSQAVRRTCQQRMVQLIPVRRGTMAMVLTVMWLLWFGLLVSHYALFVYGPSVRSSDSLATAASTISTAKSTTSIVSSSLLANWGKLPIAQLFHLRSAHGIAHWLTSQLWMFTAFASWLIFQLRRHKLDDYRARYRIWVFVGIVALFSSFDSSSSALHLLGLSIDRWTIKEIGYGGWPLVLATFASLVGVLGIRLCSELKSSPMSVVSWLTGLLVWACSALLGTGLIKTSMSPNTLDFIVGACWMGGVLAVFQAAGIYLRQTYIQAQKRFLQRQGTQLNPIQLRLPKIGLKRNSNPQKAPRREQQESDDNSMLDTKSSRWRMPWKRSRRSFDDFAETDGRSESLTVSAQSKKARVNPAELAPMESNSKSNKRSRLFGWIPQRSEQNERLEADPIRQDDGEPIDMGLTKARGWFGIGGNRPPTDAPVNRERNGKASDEDESDMLDQQAAKQKSKGWLRTKSRSTSTDSDAPREKTKAERTKRNWIPKFGRGRSTTVAEVSRETSANKVAVSHSSVSEKGDAAGKREKRSWLSMSSRKPKAADSQASATSTPAAPKSPKRSFLSMFDGLKLKPPSDDDTAATSTRGGPKPVAVQPGQALPSTRLDSPEDDSDESLGNRPLSKADRKRLRRMQQDDRRAA
jgi:hypothetical protein